MVELAKGCAFALTALMIGLMCFQYAADRGMRDRVGRRFPILLIASQVAAFLSPLLLVYNVAVAVILFLACSRRRLIAPTYLFLLLTLPLQASIMAVGGVYILTYDVGVSLGIAALIALMVRDAGRFPRSMAWDVPVYLTFILFVVIGARSTSITNIMRVSLDQATAFLLPYFVVSRSLRSFDDVRDALYGIIAAVAALSALAVFEAWRTWPMYRAVASHYGIDLLSGASVKLRGGFLRPPGPYAEPTSFAVILALGFLAVVGSRRLFAGRWQHRSILALTFLGVMAPQSRGAWIGIVLGIVAMDLYDRRMVAAAKKIGVIVALGLTVVVAAQVSPRIASLAGMTAEGQGTADYRGDLLSRGLEEATKHPIVGLPVADVMVAMADMKQGEGIVDFVNTYLYMLLVGGGVGLLVFVGGFAYPLVNLGQAKAAFPYRYLSAFLRNSSAGIVFGSLLAIAAMIAGTSMTGRTTMLFVIYIAFATAILNNLRAARQLPATPPPVPSPPEPRVQPA